MALGDGIRRNIATISEEERNLFVAAIRQLDSSAFVFPNNLGHDGADGAGNITYWDMMEQIHKDGHAHGSDVHGGPAFIPWHRAIVNYFESLLRQVDPRLSLHYWDWTTDPRAAPPGGVAILGPAGFMGSAAGDAGVPFQDFESTEPGHSVIWRNLAAGAPGIASDSTILGATNFTAFEDAAHSAHDTIHSSYIRGSIGDAHFSFHDPFVFLLHSNLDRLWATWQRAPGHPERLDPTTAYGTILTDRGLPADYFEELIQPWAGGASGTDLEPWRSDPTQQIRVSYRDPSIVTPASYDTAVHSGYIVTDRDTFSSFELESRLSYPQAFYVIYDGFTPNELSGAVPAISFHDGSIGGAAISSITASTPGAVYENAAAADMPQRISFTFEVRFLNNSAFTFPGEMRNLVIKAVHGTHVCAASMHLLNQPNPYMIDVQPGGTNPAWLSTDVRVFQLRPGGHLPGSSVDLADPADRSEAIQYIRNLLVELRGLGNGPSPFDYISQDEQASQLEQSRTVGGVRVFNFALARVRYRANTADAANVRVFFRGFNMMVSALDYTNPTAPEGNYRRSASGDVPLLGKIGSSIASIPYFAHERVDSASDDMNNQVDDANLLTINHVVNQEAMGYFGCWLDFNQTEPQFPLHPAGDGNFTSGRLSIFQLVRGLHQCLAAEVRFQQGTTDPISFGATPGSSDRLAQRNLAIVESDNPGAPDAHVVQHTLTVKPSQVPLTRLLAAKDGLFYAYDELVIRWNQLPRDTRATLFFPEWNVDEVLQLAARLRQGPALLKKVDAHTVECDVTDISYIPVPAANHKPYAGLISLQLPQTVRDGQEFQIDVQQHSGGLREARTGGNKKEAASLRYSASTRKVLGSFRITVAVKMGDGLLHKAVRNLSALRYIASAIPSTDDWHPIFARYIKGLAAKVDALGYDSRLVVASADDPGLVTGRREGSERSYTGKVRQVTYDCFGEFVGFTLETCSGGHHFESCQRQVERVVRIACRDGLTLEVVAEKGRIRQLVIRCC